MRRSETRGSALRRNVALVLGISSSALALSTAVDAHAQALPPNPNPNDPGHVAAAPPMASSSGAGPAATPTPPGSTPPDSPSASNGTTRLQEVIVTASRREENLQKESRVIDALSGAQLAQQGVASALDLNNLVPGLQVGNTGDQLQIYVRGVGDRTITSQTEPGVAFSVDGVFLPRAWESPLTFFDVQRFELLKGPQGTLYGRNATAGALNVINNPPSSTFGGYLDADFGNYNEHRFDGAINIPINDMLAARVAFQTDNHDGYLLAQPQAGGPYVNEGGNDADNQAGRFELLFRPNNDFSAQFNLEYTHNGGHGQDFVILPLVDKNNPWLSQDNATTKAQLLSSPLFAGVSNPQLVESNGSQDVNTWIADANLQWNFSGMTLTVIPAYVEGRNDNLAWAPIPNPSAIESHFESLEVRLASSDRDPLFAPLKWVVGAYESRENLSSYSYVDEGPINFITVFPKLDDTTWAVFGEGTYSLTNRLRLIGGLRYTWEQKTADGTTATDPVPLLTVPGILGATPFTDDETYTAVSWRTGVEYDVTPQSMAYFTASTGFKAGGFYAAPLPNQFAPEKLMAYELGIKNRFFDQRLQVNLEGFYWDYSNLQEQFLGVVGTGSTAGIGLVTKNAAQATLAGFDASVIALLTENDVISFDTEYNANSYGTFDYNAEGFGPPYSGCKVGPSTNAAEGNYNFDCSGFQLVKAPAWTGTADYQHTFRLGDRGSLVFDAAVHFSSAYWLATDFTPEERAPAYTLTDLTLTYNLPGGRTHISAYVKNLENTPVYNYASQTAYIPQIADVDIGPPRTYGVRLGVKF